MSSAQLPYWPPSTIGWSRIEEPPIAGEKWTHAPPPRPRQVPTGFGGFTADGREQLRTILERVLRANGRRP